MYTQAMLILILANVQYSQEAVFSFEKGSNGQNHFSSKVCTGGGGGGELSHFPEHLHRKEIGQIGILCGNWHCKWG